MSDIKIVEHRRSRVFHKNSFIDSIDISIDFL